MQFLNELPAILGMFLCGALGYFIVDFIKKKATANVRDQKKSKQLKCDLQLDDMMPSGGTKSAEHPAEGARLAPESANCQVAAKQAQTSLNPRVERLLAKKATRKARKAQAAATAVVKEAGVAAPCATDPCEDPVNGAPGSDAETGMAMPYVADDLTVARESTAEPNSAEEEAFPINFHKEESDLGSASTDEATRRVSGFRLRRRTSRWADDESGEGEDWELDEEERRHLFDDLDEEERCRLLGEFPDTTDDEGSDLDVTWSEDENDDAIIAAHISGVKPSVPIKPGPELEKRLDADGSFPASRGKSNRRSRRVRERKRRRNKANKRHVKDDWMTPFSELLMGHAGAPAFSPLHVTPVGPAGAPSPRVPLVMQAVDQPLLPPVQHLPYSTQPLLPPSGDQPVVPSMPGQPMVSTSIEPGQQPNINPTGPAVCIWNTTSPSAAMTCVDGNQQDIFTDGSQVFQPVPSTTGQPLFTDGKQLYASVCVMLGPPPSSEMRGPPLPELLPESISMMEYSGTVDEHSGANLISCLATSDEDDWD